MKKWQIENLETSEILFRVFLFPSFRFYTIAKIENSDLKISGKNFRAFRVFDLATNYGCYKRPACPFFSIICQKCSEGNVYKFIAKKHLKLNLQRLFSYMTSSNT